MGTSVATISGVVYDGALTTPGSTQFQVAISNPTPPNLTATTITTSTTTNITKPTNAMAAFINCNLSAGTVTVGGQALAPIGPNLIGLPTATGNVVIVTTGITGTVEVTFI